MKTKYLLLLIMGWAISQFSFGQTHKEYYFKFPIHSRAEISMITKQISIDNVRNDTVWAYANDQEFVRFARNGYDITLLPPPGYVPGVVMNDNPVLAPMTTWNFYPTYTAYESYMTGFQTNYPSICQVQTIATLASGRKLMVVKISDNVATDENEPEFLYTSSIHGDETTGYVLMLHLIDYLLSNYGTNTEVTDLVNNLEIYINPLANPDGTYAGGNTTVSGATRANANGVDMNRNYPDPQDGDHPDGNAWQPETIAFMDFATQHHFAMSCNFHGGAEVVNYPWDTWATLNADDNWWIYVSAEYADTAQIHAPSGYMTDVTSTGYTNGFAWYEVDGGRQDYMNYFQHCREVTIELSATKTPEASSLLSYWDYNWRSLILYLKEARYGIHGTITDQSTGLPVAAKVYISGHDNNNSEVYSSANLGDYHRPIKAGTYTLTVSATCYQAQTIANVVVTDHNTVNLNIQLVPSAGVNTTAASSITMTTASSGGNVVCDGGSPITARGVCWSTTANPTTSNSHTTDGSGTGTFASSITGLSSNTLYHVRAYATNTSGTVYGSDLTFTTSCGAVTSFPWSEGFENAGAIPSCWSQEQVNSSGLNWTFITGNGGSYPATAHGGTYNACLKDNSATDNKTKLISPPINLTGVGSPTLTFWHYQRAWSSDQDQLVVYYRTSSSGTWTSLASYTSSVTSWTQRTISLPNGSTDYYIAFEGNAKYGYGVCIDDVSITGTTSPTLAVTPANQSVSAAAGTTAFTVTSNSSWTASSDQAWCMIAPGSGTSNGTLTATFTQNGTTASRSANITVTVTGLTPVVVTVTQAAPTLSVTPSNQNVTSDAGSAVFSVTSNSAWSVSSNQSWCTVTSSGSGNGSISATYTQNLSLSQRVATLTVSVTGLTPVQLTVTQAGFVPTLSVTPSNQDVASSAGVTTFTVTSNTSWTATSDQPWCTVTPSGTGNATLTANYSLNTNTVSRVANITVTVSGLTPVVVTVTQAAAVLPDFYYTIDNIVQTSYTTFEFDLLLVDNDASQPFELATVQAGILLDPGIYNGGTITASIVPGTSTLNASQQPTSVVYTQSANCLKLAAKAPPGAGGGTIISTNASNPTRICRLKISNTVWFTTMSSPMPTFNFATTPYPTKMSQYISGVNTALTLNTSNTYTAQTYFFVNPPLTLSVSPSNQTIVAAAGSTTFNVTSTGLWSASSDQSWCSVSPSGAFGNGVITATCTENTSTAPRVANITVTLNSLPTQVVTVTQNGIPNKTLNLTLYLEGLYDGGGMMHPVMDESGVHWGATIADKLTIELHDAGNYSTIVYSASNVDLNTNGTASVTLPSAISGNYYLTIRHRNSIETVSGSPLSFAASTVTYNFDSASKAFGGNLKSMPSGYWVIFGGDVNQDGLVDSGDMIPVDNDATGFATGYLDTDLNGDGLVDSGDMILLDNNSAAFVSSVKP